MALVTIADLNGDHYLGLQEGETLVSTRETLVLFPPGMEVATEPLRAFDIAQDAADLFLRLNVLHLSSLTVGGTKRFTVAESAVISYHRLIAVRMGLISPAFNPAQYFVKYNDAEYVAEDKMPTDAELASVGAGITAALPALVQKSIVKTATDRVALVAFVFRARGHHYLDQYQELYERVWSKCRYDRNALHISFQNLAVASFHAIFPVVLDAFWTQEVQLLHVNGALAKRYDVAPAGAAGPYVLFQGVQDLMMIAPGIRGRLEDAVLYLEETMATLKKHRFAGSVNARYYNTGKVVFDEKRLSAIAATIKAALDNLTSDAPLGKSPALNRIANNAPITGSVLGRAIRGVADRPEVVDTLMHGGVVVNNNQLANA